MWLSSVDALHLGSRHRSVDATKRVPTERSVSAKDFGELSQAVHLGLATATGATKQPKQALQLDRPRLRVGVDWFRVEIRLASRARSEAAD